MEDRSLKRLRKKARRGLRGWPLATIAFYGPNLSNDQAGGTPMKLPRRKFLHLTAGAAALSVSSRIARAQTYPARPVSIVVGYAPGGVTDIIARLIGPWLGPTIRR